MVAAGFVFPASGEAAEADAVECFPRQVEIHDSIREWVVRIVVAADGEDCARAVMCHGALNGSIEEIAAGDEDIHGAVQFSDQGLVIGDGYYVHIGDLFGHRWFRASFRSTPAFLIRLASGYFFDHRVPL